MIFGVVNHVIMHMQDAPGRRAAAGPQQHVVLEHDVCC